MVINSSVPQKSRKSVFYNKLTCFLFCAIICMYFIMLDIGQRAVEFMLPMKTDESKVDLSIYHRSIICMALALASGSLCRLRNPKSNNHIQY